MEMKQTIFKLGTWLLALLFGAGGIGVVGYFALTGSQIPKSIYSPKAPQIVDQKYEGGCGVKISWADNELHEDGVYFYRRVAGQPNFVAIQVTGPHAGVPGTFNDTNLPIGTYEYRVGVFNQYGTSYSNISEGVSITSAYCGNEPLLIKPLNPLIVSTEILPGTCTVRVHFTDNSLDEDGLRIYRESWVDNQNMIAEFGPHNGTSGTYDDPNLPPGHYTYQISVFNANGESFSNISQEVEITNFTCATPMDIDPGSIPPSAPGPELNACIWKSAINVFVRKGPGASAYSEITAVEAETELPVVGQSEDMQFWVVELKKGVLGYVPKADRFGSTAGDCDAPVVNDPKPSTTPATPVPPGRETVLPQCSDGIDNDLDGLIDMRDPDCESPSDDSED